MNNLVVQLLLKTGTFSTDLKTARGQIQNFQQGCQTAGRSLSGFGQALGINVGALTKFGGAVGAAVVAGKALKGILDSTQTSADAFDGAIAGCKGVVDALAVSIASADFSTFQNGLWGVFDAAKAARDALDDLQDATLGYGMLSSKNRRGFTEAQTAYKEAETAYKNAKTQAEKDKYKAEMERQKSIMSGFVTDEEKNARNFEAKNFKAIRAQVRARNTNINEKDITSEMIYEVAEIFNSVDSDKRRKEYKEAAKNVKKEAKKYDTDSKRDQYYQKHQRELIIDALLEMGQEKIEAVAQELQAGETARTSSSALRKTFDRTIRGEDRTTGGSGGGKSSTTQGLKDEIPVLKESREYWVRLRTEAEKYRNGQVYDSKKWNEYNDIVREAIQNIQELDEKEKARNKRRDIEDSGLMDKLPELPKIEGKVEIGPDPKTVKYTATELDHLIKLYTQWRSELEEGDPLIAKYNQKIKEFGDRLNAINSTGLPEPSIKKETINTWDEFNSAMANTSTIVSSLSNTFKESSEVTVASILQMVSTALPAIGSLISSIQALSAAEAVEAGVAATGKAVSTSKHWIEAIAAVAALGAAVATAVSAAQRPQRFANGGIVGGSSFTGDRVTAQVNSGEMILNKTQQARLFQLANGSAAEEKEVNFRISGTDLVGVLNNQTRKNRLIR